MELPPGWQARLTGNSAVVAASGDGSTIVIAPAPGAGGEAAGNWLQQAGPAVLGQYLRNPVITGIYPSRTGPGSALATVDCDTPAGPGSANVLSFFAGGVGTLYVIAAPKAVFPQQRPVLVRILRSFTFTGAGAAAGAPGAPQAASGTRFTHFRDPNEGAFSMDVPAGWKIEGGLVRKSTLDTRPFLWATSPDGSTLIRMRDPGIGSFVIPSQTLAFAGLQEGMPYSPGYGNVFLISRYMPGPQFAQQYALKLAGDTQSSDLQFKAVSPRQDLTGTKTTGIVQEQTTGGEAAFTCVHNGRAYCGTVVAATTLVVVAGTPDASLWHVQYLASYVTPQELAENTDQAFQHMLQSVEWNPQWVAMQSQTAYRTGQIAREASQYAADVMDETYWRRQRSLDRSHQNYIDSLRGVVRLKDPNTGEELEGVAGRNYYYRVLGGNPIGSDREIRRPDFTELEQMR